MSREVLLRIPVYESPDRQPESMARRYLPRLSVFVMLFLLSTGYWYAIFTAMDYIQMLREAHG